MKRFLSCFLLFVGMLLPCNAENRWHINSDGSISWSVKENDSHNDHIEMSGLKVSTVLRYGVNPDGSFYLNRSIVWPLLRTIPNNTHASLMRRFGYDVIQQINLNGYSLSDEKVEEITLDGTLTVRSLFNRGSNWELELTRKIFPSTTKASVCEIYRFRNTGKENAMLDIPSGLVAMDTEESVGVDGSYHLVTFIDGGKSQILKPGETAEFHVVISGYKKSEQVVPVDVQKELEARMALVKQWKDNLILETPDTVINTMFSFAKVRASESIYDTKGGLMHGPGGESYYAAIWANDQAEYVNPFFPFLGYEIGNKSAFNSFRLFSNYMNEQYDKLPSSIIAEGLDTWGGAGDRGDAAMIAYGASRYALARGDKQEAEQLWPLIEWCLEYSRRQLNEEGVVKSDADELENRFPAGEANLCTSSLYYDALNSAVYLGKELGKPAKQISDYRKRAVLLRENIDRYFGGNVEGFDTYHYYKGNDVLRSWICIPLTVGIYDRKEATVSALFSPRLWTKDGLLTQAGSETFWDRSTLYALRGVFACGETEKALGYLQYYSNTRLLGEHVPYAIEAWPEGNQRHLSAESGLYARIVTEGLFGIRPTGLRSFTCTPRLPKIWENMALRKIRAFNANFDILVERRSQEKIRVTIVCNGKHVLKKTIEDGASLQVKL